MTIDDDNRSRGQKVLAAINFILAHPQQPPETLFPRTIMTASTPGQITVNSREEIFARFRAANYKDCRINAFPKYTNYNGINRQPASFIFIDLDVSSFDYDMVRLEKVLNKTRKKIADVFGNEVVPTVLWTGGGYHVYLPLSGNIVLEQYDVFAEFADWWRVHECKDLTSVFMGFAERFLTGDKNDKGHTPTVKSCLLRVPYTINSKYTEVNEVQILQSTYRCGGGDNATSSEEKATLMVAAVQYILKDFRYYLFDHHTKLKLKELKQFKKQADHGSRQLKRMQANARRMGMVLNDKRILGPEKINGNCDSNAITPWIECLLQIGIDDYRKRAVRLILAPYLLHKKKLSYEQAAQVTQDWLLNRCEPLRHVKFNANYIIRYALKNSSKKPEIYHMKFDTLAKYNPELHRRLQQEMLHR